MRTRWMFLLVPLLAACDSTGPSHLWTHEGVIESGYHMVAEVDQYATITCQIDGRTAAVWTGDGATGAHCLKRYSQITEGGIVRPVHTLYIANGPIGKRYGVRVE